MLLFSWCDLNKSNALREVALGCYWEGLGTSQLPGCVSSAASQKPSSWFNGLFAAILNFLLSLSLNLWRLRNNGTCTGDIWGTGEHRLYVHVCVHRSSLLPQNSNNAPWAQDSERLTRSKELNMTQSKYKINTLYIESVFLFFSIVSQPATSTIRLPLATESYWIPTGQGPLESYTHASCQHVYNWVTGNTDSPKRPWFPFDQSLSNAGGRQCCLKKEEPPKHPLPFRIYQPLLLKIST